MALKFAVDIQAKRLIKSPLLPDPFVLPPFIQGDTHALEIQFAEPNYASGYGAYSVKNISNLTLRVAIMGHKPIGNLVDTPEVLQTVWVKDTATNTFQGVLALGGGITTLLGGESEKTAYFEIELRDGATGYYETVFPWAECLVRAEEIEDGILVTPPVSGGTAVTVAEGNQLWVKRRGLPGEFFSIVSANAQWERIIGVDDNGEMVNSVVPYVP
jgi:hypothetical protein